MFIYFKIQPIKVIIMMKYNLHGIKDLSQTMLKIDYCAIKSLITERDNIQCINSCFLVI